MSAARCFYADASRRGVRSPDCAPGPFASYVVRGYFVTTNARTGRARRAPLHLCRAHAEHHAHLRPQPMNGGAR